ncbi:MAG: tryptophan--tRNA ligase, partial [Anaerococcus sp.]|nr:tryptophan--tRNA ligase [Anaerococcus sp.]
NTVFTYLDAFCEDHHFEKFYPEYKNLDELKDHYRRGGLGDVKIKKFLNKVLEDFLEPIRERRAYYAKDISKLFEIMENGSKEASDYGKMKLKQVKEAMGINYFDDKKLILELQRKYDHEYEK